MINQLKVQERLSNHHRFNGRCPCICLSTNSNIFFKTRSYLRTNKIVITLIHQNEGYTFLLMTDNLRANQACCDLCKEIFESTGIFSCKHSVENEEFENLCLLFDPIHLLNFFRKN